MAKGNFVKLYDTIEFKFLDPNLKKVKDDYEGAFKQTPPTQSHISGLGSVPAVQNNSTTTTTANGLLIRIAATHAGIITRNHGFYLPDRMKKGATSFTKDFEKPVLLHHEDHQDPIGRIREAAYMDTSGSIIDKYKGLEVKNKAGKVIGTITDVMIKDFNSGAMPYAQQIDVTSYLFKDSLLEDESYEGLGHIQLVANISDPEAIQKLLDGRYLTGSVGATTDSAVCSICRTDWTDSGFCEHKPGAVYDGAKCFIIAGNLIYDEYSFVNVPADRHSRVIQLNYNGIQDSVSMVNDSKSSPYEVSLEFPQYMEDKTMEPTGDVQIQDAVTTPEAPAVEAPATETPAVETQTVVTDQTITEQPVIQDNAQPATLDLDSLITKALGTEVISDEESEALYSALWNEVVECAKSGVLVMEQKALEDAKLSTEKRKSLPKSSFCGPGKSFPVPDCAHVTAARRLIGRYKGGGDKSAILACVARKAKAMGCDSEKDSVTDSLLQPIDPQVALLKKMLANLETENAKPVDLSKEEIEQLTSLFKKMANSLGKDSVMAIVSEVGFIPNEKDLLDEIMKNEETIGTLREQVKALKEEYNALFEDMQSIQDSLIKEKTDKRKTKESHLQLLTALKETKVETKDFTNLSDAVLDQEVERMFKEVDIQKITDKLGDGMARQPTETVVNPIAITDSSKQVTVADLMKIEEHYMYLRFTRGEAAAEAYLNAMRREGKLPQSKD